MASAPSDPKPVLGRIDSAGRLIAADPALASLQEEAGSRIGAVLALPQVAAVARLARQLRIPISRRAIAARAEKDVDLFVTAIPDGEEIALSIQGWVERPLAGPRLAPLVGSSGDDRQLAASGEWSADEELRLLSLSQELAERLGIDLADAVGAPLTRLLRLEEDEKGAMPLLSAAAARHSFSGQRAKSRMGGETLILSGEVAIGADGGFAGFTGSVTLESDHTAAEQGSVPSSTLEESLDDALRSPLDRIIACAERIVERTDGPLRSDYAAYANDIAAAARHLLSVIGGMHEEMAAGPISLDLSALATEALSILESAVEERRVAIDIQQSGAQPVQGEERAVLQILINLIGNAIRYSPEGGTVAISFGRSGATASVSISDSGPGIASVDQQRIFERFERADKEESGTGLGLAIARRLARSMDGDISVESAPGQGARFTLSLPAA